MLGCLKGVDGKLNVVFGKLAHHAVRRDTQQQHRSADAGRTQLQALFRRRNGKIVGPCLFQCACTLDSAVAVGVRLQNSQRLGAACALLRLTEVKDKSVKVDLSPDTGLFFNTGHGCTLLCGRAAA